MGFFLYRPFLFLLLYSCRKTKDSRSFLHGNSNMSNGCFGQFVWKLNSNIYHRRNIYFATDAFNFTYWSSGIFLSEIKHVHATSEDNVHCSTTLQLSCA